MELDLSSCTFVTCTECTQRVWGDIYAEHLLIAHNKEFHDNA